jgi:hypothetical protein
MEGENRLLGRPVNETKLTALQGNFVFVFRRKPIWGREEARPLGPLEAASAAMILLVRRIVASGAAHD